MRLIRKMPLERSSIEMNLGISWQGPERLLLNHAKTPGFLAPGGEEFNPRPETMLDRSELLCTSDIGIRRGQKEYPLASVNNEVI